VLTALAAGAGALAVGSLSRPAWAHRAHVSLTRVLGNPRAGTWEFLHSIHIHDAITVDGMPTIDYSPDNAGNILISRLTERILAGLR